MVYESSYESGRKPFTPDLARGIWSAPSDFLYACLSFALNAELYLTSWMILYGVEIISIIPFMVCVAILVAPILVIQSFLGQFSSTGFISVFRMAPLFKGIGYASIVLNFTVLAYYTTYAMMPLLFLINSFRPTLPWSCDHYDTWRLHHNLSDFEANICDLSTYSENSTLEESSYYVLPSSLFLRRHFTNILDDYEMDFVMSWELVLCSLFVWTIILFAIKHCSSVERFGKLMRYMIWTILCLIVTIFVRTLFLPTAWKIFANFFSIDLTNLHACIASLPSIVLLGFGSGWGTVITFASFNRFKTNIVNSSWLLALGHMIIFLLFSLTFTLIDNHISLIRENLQILPVEYHWNIYLVAANVLAELQWSNLWCIIFFTFLTLAALLVLTTQLYSLFASIFDEFEMLRARKDHVIYATVGLLALFSLYFTSNHGLDAFEAILFDMLFTQAALNLLLVLVIVWVYGRVRFQRDLEFMIGQRFSTWIFNLVRFVAPFCLILLLLIAGICSHFEHYNTSDYLAVLAIIFIASPWIIIPAYAIFVLLQATGTLKLRFQRCIKPTDWYPVESEDRQRYEEAMGNSDITHQLKEVTEEVL